MITVRIPDEIRKYKEKLIWGMTARQIICAALAILICVPLYFWGGKFIPEDIIAWAVILIAMPLFATGFIKINGLPMEKFAVAAFKFFVSPSKRTYKTNNAFREWNKKGEEAEKPKSSRDRAKLQKYWRASSLERVVLMQEAEERGDMMKFKVDEAETVTVSRPKVKYPTDNDESENNLATKDSTLKLSPRKRKIIMQGEGIKSKMENFPEYVLTPAETKALRKYNQFLADRRKKELISKKKSAAKKNAAMKKRRTASYTIPRSTADTIPIIATYDEGMFEVAPNKYSKMYRIKDINYKTAKQEEQEAIFVKLSEFYNYFSEDMHFSICLDNKVVSIHEQEQRIFYPDTGDEFDVHRHEYNSIMKRAIIAGRNDTQLQKFITITIDAAEPLEALMRFHKIDAEIAENLKKIGSDAQVLSTTERLSYFHDKFRAGHEGEFKINYDFLQKQGLSAKDYIAPTSFNFSNKHFQIGEDFYRVLYLSNLPASLSDEFLYSVYNVDFPLTVSMNVQPIAQARGLKIVKRQLTGIEMNKIDAEKRAVKAGYSPDTIRHDIKDAHERAEQLYDDMMNKDQKMFFVSFTFMVKGATLEELNENCKIIEGKASSYTTQLMTLNYQQEEAFKQTLPFGYVSSDLAVDRTLTTESTAIFMPFSNQELFQSGGFYYGMNAISFNLVVVDRNTMKTPSGFALGTSGSGKSFAIKREILNVLLHDSKTNVIIIDPENEYADFCRVFKGSIVKLSADSDCYINPMDMSEDYGLDEDDDFDLPMPIKKEKAVKKKSDYIMSIIERMISVGGNPDQTFITPTQKTVVDRCVRRCYETYLQHNFAEEYLPTLMDLQNEFDREKEYEAQDIHSSGAAREIAEGVEYYTRGSMNVFAHRTNIDLQNRLIVFNIRDLGKQLEQIALTIVFDYIWNRMVKNKNAGVRTYCYADEIHVMFRSYYSANFLKQLYKRGRKYGLCITGITQNVSDLLASEEARGMLGNSDFILMLNQKSRDLQLLTEILNISETQKHYVTDVDAGNGLIFAEKVIVPFVDKFPDDSYLYSLMSTKFGEEMSNEDVNRIIEEIMQMSEEAQAS